MTTHHVTWQLEDRKQKPNLSSSRDYISLTKLLCLIDRSGRPSKENVTSQRSMRSVRGSVLIGSRRALFGRENPIKARRICLAEPDFLKCFVCFIPHLKRRLFTKWRGRQTKQFDFLKMLHFMPRFIHMSKFMNLWQCIEYGGRVIDRETDDIMGWRSRSRAEWRTFSSFLPRLTLEHAVSLLDMQ